MNLTLKFLAILLMLTTLQCVNAQNTTKLIAGDDLISIQSANLNSKTQRSKFSKDDELYVKLLSTSTFDELLEKQDGEILAINFVSGPRSFMKLIYPELRRELQNNNEAVFALQAPDKLPKEVLNLQPEFEQILKDKKVDGPLELTISIVITDKKKNIIQTLSSQDITLK